MNRHATKFSLTTSAFLGIVVFILLSLLTQYLAYQKYIIGKREDQQKISDAANVARNQLQNALYHSLSATKTLAFLVEKYGVPSDFDAVAKGLIESNKYIDAIEIVQKGTITHVYPLNGNEAVIGYNILADSTRNKEALKAIEKRDLFFAGPLKLKQGGMGVVGRQPIFVKDNFVGFAVVLIRLETLLRAAGIDTPNQSGFSYKLSKVNPDTGEEEFFTNNETELHNMRYVAVTVPNGAWNLYAGFKSAGSLWSLLPFLLAGIAFSVMGGLFVYYKAKEPEKLNRVIDEKVAELMSVESQYAAVFQNSLYALFLSKPDGTIIQANQAACDMLGYSEAELRELGRHGIIDHSDPGVDDKLQERRKTGRTRGELTCIRKNGERVPVEFSSVIFEIGNGEERSCTVMVDISERKKNEREMNLLINNTEESFILLNKDLVITGFNRQFKTLYKEYFNLDFKVGDLILKYAQPERRMFVDQLYQRVLSGSSETSEISIPTPSHGKKVISLKYAPARDDRGEIVGAFVTAADVTEQREREHVNRELLLSNVAARKLFQNVLDSISDGFVALDKDWHYTYVNERGAAMLNNHKPEQLIGKHIWTIFPEGLTQPFYLQYDKVMKERTALTYLEHYEPWDRYFENRIYPADDGGITIFFTDVTERIKTTEQVRQTQKVLKRIWDSSLDVICTFNDKGEFIEVSSAALNVWGYTEEELKGKRYIDFVCEDDRELTNRVAAEIMSGNDKTDFQNRYHRKNGTVAYMLWSAHWDEEERIMYCIAKDVSEKRKTEEQILISEQRFKTLVQDGSDLIGILDTEGNYMYVSPSSHGVLGIAPEEFVGKSAFSFIHPDDLERVITSFSMLGSDKRIQLAPFRFKHKDGSWRWIETTVTNMTDDPAIGGIISNSRDITSRIRNEEILKKSEQKYRYLFANNPAPMFIWDFETRNIVDCNEEALIKYGYTRDEFLRLSIRDIRPPEDVPLIDAATVSKEVYGEVHRKVWRHQTKSGRIMFVEITGHTIEYDGRNMVIVQVNEVTDKLKAEQELLISNDRYNYVTKATSDAIWDWDIKSGALYWGEGFKTLFGYESNEMEAHISDWSGRIHKDDLERITTDIDALIKGTKEKWEDEYRYRKADGSYAFVIDRGFVIRNAGGEAIRMVGAIQDISRRKKEEQQLRLLESVVTNTTDAIVITEAAELHEPGPRIVYVNDAFTQMSGYAFSEVIGRSPRFLQGPATDSVELKKMSESLQKGEACELTLVNYKKNGEEFWNNFSISPVMDVSGKVSHFIAIERDVTDRKNKEQQQLLLASVSKIFNEDLSFHGSLKKVLKTVAETGNYSLAECWLADADKQFMNLASWFTADEQVKEFYSHTEYFRKVSRGEGLPGKVWQSGEVLHWSAGVDDGIFVRAKPAEKAGLEKISAVPLFYNNEVIGVMLLGFSARVKSRFTLAGNASEFGKYLGVEIKRKQIEQELGQIFNVAPDVICIVDFQGNFRKINPAAEFVFGYPETDLLSKPYFEMVYPADLEDTRKGIDRLRTEKNTVYIENRNYTADGEIKWLAWTLAAAPGEDLIFAVAKDITERKHSEDRLSQLNRDLVDQARELQISNAELEQFAYVASHDLQEPLRMVSSFLTQLEKKYKTVLDDKAKQYIYYAVDGAKRMRRIILDLLEFSRVGRTEDKKELVDLNEVVEEIKVLLHKQVEEKNARIEHTVLPFVFAPRSPVYQIFQNLIENALKYNNAEQPFVNISATERSDSWEFSIADNGIGISHEYFDKIFIIFQRLHHKDEYSGTGMGLAIVKKLVENLGGTIWLESEEGKGSTFHFTLLKTREYLSNG